MISSIAMPDASATRTRYCPGAVSILLASSSGVSTALPLMILATRVSGNAASAPAALPSISLRFICELYAGGGVLSDVLRRCGPFRLFDTRRLLRDPEGARS